MATMYRSTDSGAPAFPASASYDGAKYFMEVIKACLVTGYGAQAAAGWTLDYETTTANKHRLAVSNGNGVVEFITKLANEVVVYIWDEITTPGVGNLGVDTYASVISTGVNGWASAGVDMPAADTELVVGILTSSLNTANNTNKNIAWTVFADDKSAWVLFHYGDGHSSAEPADQLSKNSNFHPQLFIGALKSPDLLRAQAGNFFVGYGGTRAANVTATNNSSEQLNALVGLRTPLNATPAVDVAPYAFQEWTQVGQNANHHSSVRLLLPLCVSFDGADKPVPAGINTAYDEYAFAVMPGVAQFGNNTATHNFWAYYNAANAATWNHQIHTINGTEWMPWTLRSTNQLSNYGVTTDADWWT